MIYLGNNRLKKSHIGGSKLKKAYVGANQVYSAGNYVTYYVDSDEIYTEEVEYEASCLSPTTFTPSKSGWTFLGWRQDTTATSSVLSSLTMGDEEITLYAVFKQSVTLTYYSTDSTKRTRTGTRYYNNGNIANPAFTISSPSVSGWTFLGWISGSTSATGAVSYASISDTEFSADATLYAKFSQTITLSYNGNSSTSGSTSSQTGTRHWNAYGNYSNPSFTLRSNGFSRTGYTFSKWAKSSASGTQYSAGASVTLSESTTFYAVWTAQVCKVYLYLYPDGGSQDGYVKVQITLNSSGTTVYSTSLSQDDIYESTGDVFGSVTCAGIVAVSYFQTDDYPAVYYTSQARVTAKATLYSNTGLSTVGLSSGSSIYYNQHDQVGTRSATYYVSYDKLSL